MSDREKARVDDDDRNNRNNRRSSDLARSNAPGLDHKQSRSWHSDQAARRMIAVALLVIIGVVAVTCGIVADSNHADTLTFLGLIVKTTAAQIFLSGAICTWALFASLWLLSTGVRRSKERGLELRLLKALRRPGLSGAAGAASTESMETPAATSSLAGLAPTIGTTSRADDQAMSAPTPHDSIGGTNRASAIHAARPTDSTDPANSADQTQPSTDSADSEPTIDFDDYLAASNALGRLHAFADLSHVDDPDSPSPLDQTRSAAKPTLGRHVERGRFYRAAPQPNSAD